MNPLFFGLAAATAGALCESERSALVNAAGAIETQYVLKDQAVELGSWLRKWANESPRTTQCRSAQRFARELTKKLRQTSEDGHFLVETVKGPGTDWVAAWKRQAPRIGYGIQRVEVLENNIGLLRISTFYGLELVFERLRAALTLLEQTDALIVDLRGNQGGSDESTWPLQWTFLTKGSPPPLILESRGQKLPGRDEPPILWPRYGADRPLAILLDSGSVSAAEAFAYALQATGRATVVGKPSAGAAHMLGDAVEISHGLQLSIPTVRPLSPQTGSNWEGAGVRPDIEAPPDQALRVAKEYLAGLLEERKASTSKTPP